MSKARLVLASKSPRRSELLTLLGFGFTVVPSRAEEIPSEGEAATDFVRRAARDKGLEVATTYVWFGWFYRRTPIVVIDDEILGKPIDESDAIRMLEQLRRSPALGIHRSGRPRFGQWR